MDEKTTFLGNVRAALGYSRNERRSVAECTHLFAKSDDAAILQRIRYRTHVEKQTLLTVLQENALNLQLQVHPVRSHEMAAQKIVGIVSASSPEFTTNKQIIQHDHPDIADLHLWKYFSGQPLQIHTAYSADGDIREKTVASYIGITSPRWVVAESATVVQFTEPGKPRSTSLVPSVHIAVMRLKHILADLSELYAVLRKDPPSSSFVFISGPSKTADIEAHMVHGAHGPKEMHLVIIDESMKEEGYRGSGLFSE